MYLLTQKRPQGDLRATNRQDSTDPAVVVGLDEVNIANQKNHFSRPKYVS